MPVHLARLALAAAVLAVSLPAARAAAHDFIPRAAVRTVAPPNITPGTSTETSPDEGAPADAGATCEELIFEKFDARKTMGRALAAARAKIESIKANTVDGDVELRVLAKLVLPAVEAAVGKHQAVFDAEPNWNTLNTGRHFAILTEIANFDPAKPKWSLYKIDRMIKEQHSRHEYEKCK